MRVERISVGEEGLVAHAVTVEHLGAETIVGFKLGPATTEVGAAASRDLHLAKIPGELQLEPGAECRVRLDLDGTSWFDVSGDRLAEAREPTRA